MLEPLNIEANNLFAAMEKYGKAQGRKWEKGTGEKNFANYWLHLSLVIDLYFLEIRS